LWDGHGQRPAELPKLGLLPMSSVTVSVLSLVTDVALLIDHGHRNRRGDGIIGVVFVGCCWNSSPTAVFC